MPRHEFQPGKLVVGLFLTAGGIAYAGDAAGRWETEWFAIIPVVFVGLCLAGAVATVNHAVRRRRAARRPPGVNS
ncbi:hypothetical protein ABZ871_37170 [Streptomyces populi]